MTYKPFSSKQASLKTSLFVGTPSVPWCGPWIPLAPRRSGGKLSVSESGVENHLPDVRETEAHASPRSRLSLKDPSDRQVPMLEDGANDAVGVDCRS